MTFTFKTFLLIVDLSPTALFSTKIDPQVNRGAEILVAGIAKFNLVNLTRLKADGGGAGVTLKGPVIFNSPLIGWCPVTVTTSRH